MTERISHINALMGRPYELGGQGPQSYDCYSCTAAIQRLLFSREMPAFTMPAQAGRTAIAAAISVHPERLNWREIDAPVDGAIVTMARQNCGYHLGTWLATDGGLIIHAMENIGIVADTIPSLQAVGWRRFRYHVPT